MQDFIFPDQEKRFPVRDFTFPDREKRFPPRGLAFPTREKRFPARAWFYGWLRWLVFPGGSKDRLEACTTHVEAAGQQLFKQLAHFCDETVLFGQHQNACGSDDWNILLNRIFSGIVVIDDKQEC